ncbi:MAG: hypothetical protein HS113_11275 [Verrucomicrobiales bacterium]|nr:hypothetical protein [Verrucomicrobiales bacterium]
MFALLLPGCGLRAMASADDAPPAFAIRGTLPWHNFLSGPTAWNASDYRVYLDDLAARGLNFVGFHCYTGGAERYAPYVEPLIRIQYRDVVPVAGFDTSMTARWGYRPLAVRDFAFETGNLFPLPPGAEAFGGDGAVTARSHEERYRRAQGLMGEVIAMAHARGIQVAIGFEFGVHPPELASIVPPESRIGGALLPDPTHPANIEILHATLRDLLTTYPGLDWVWLWLHEHSMFVAPPELAGRFAEFYQREKGHFSGAPREHDVFTGVWSLVQIRQVHEYLSRHAPRTRLAIGGWGGGPQLPPVLRGLDRALPRDIVFSCLNPGMGGSGHAPVLAEVAAHRPTWAIPWFEGDAWLWHLQPRAASIRDQVKAAHADRLSGVIGIHWRTEEIRMNLEAFALTARDPEQAPSGEALYRRHCTERYGAEAADTLAPLLLRFEQENQLGTLSSPEYFPYSPAWGRLPPGLEDPLRAAIALIERLESGAGSPVHRQNLGWLADNFRGSLLLDEVGRKIEAAYTLKEQYLRGEMFGTALREQAQAARAQFETAPIEELFRTFARRVRSRGELGELSSLNQKLWLQHRELDQFLREAAAHP